VEPPNLQAITSAVAPVVMVSAAGLIVMGVQTKNLHLADRIRSLTSEYRSLTGEPQDPRREPLRRQLEQFARRIRLSQWALEFLYISIVCFVTTSLILASSAWVGGPELLVLVALLFLVGVAFFLIALLVEYMEMRLALNTIVIEIASTLADGDRSGIDT
jgi:hypothetical protein